MNIWLWGLAFILGFIGGMITMACCAAASRADEVIERAVREEERKRQKGDTRPMVEIVNDTKEVIHGGN